MINQFSSSLDAWFPSITCSNASSADKLTLRTAHNVYEVLIIASHFIYWFKICFPVVSLPVLVLHFGVTQIPNPSPSFQFFRYVIAIIRPTKTLQRPSGNASKLCYYQHRESLLELFQAWPSFSASGIFFFLMELGSYFNMKWFISCASLSGHSQIIESKRSFQVSHGQVETWVHVREQTSKLAWLEQEACTTGWERCRLVSRIGIDIKENVKLKNDLKLVTWAIKVINI